MRTLKAICDKSFDVVLTTPDAAVQLTMPKNILLSSTKTISVGDTYDQKDLVAFLHQNGYIRVDMVDGAGQYAVRGGILDVFAPQASEPVRIDFFDTEIERISAFDIMTQRRTDDVDTLTLIPTRELLLRADRRAELISVIEEQSKHAKKEEVKATLQAELAALRGETDLAFLDKYLTCIYPESTCLLDYADADTCIILPIVNALNMQKKANIPAKTIPTRPPKQAFI
jgi:transcription-repair coupling factor (superfamily II helicase)